MKKVSISLRVISLISLLTGLIGFILAPPIIATHFTSTNRVDATGAAWQVFLLPAIQIIIDEGLIFKAKRQRRRTDDLAFDFVLPQERTYIAIAIVLLLVFTFSIYQMISYR